MLRFQNVFQREYEILYRKFVPLLFYCYAFQDVLSLVFFKFGRALSCGTSMGLVVFFPRRHVL